MKKSFGYLEKQVFKYPLKVKDIWEHWLERKRIRKTYINDKICEWAKEGNMLADIATTHPEAAYTANVTSYQHKLTHLLRNIPNIEDQLKKIDEVVRHKLIPASIAGHIINDAERVMLSLPTRLGGLGRNRFRRF